MNKDRYVILGRVSGAYGIKGWIRVHSETDPVQNILQYRPWFLQTGDSWQEYNPLGGRRQGKGMVARLQQCADRDAAEALKGCAIAVKRQQLPDSGNEHAFYWTDLEGLRVLTTQGDDLGMISHLFETGSNDVMVVQGDRERLIPYIWEQVVCQVDLENRQMLVDWDKEF